MSRMMQSAARHDSGVPLIVGEWPMLRPGPGQILVLAEAGGVCHTDPHPAHDEWSLKSRLSFIPSHQGIGRVVALGAGARGVKRGDRVGVPCIFSASREGEEGLVTWKTVSDQAESGANPHHGGGSAGEYIVANSTHAARIPAGLSAQAAAPLIGAGVTSYKGLKEAHVRHGEWVVISGLDGLGHLAVQYAKAMGMLVCAVDEDDDKLLHATRLGAHAVVNTAQAGALAEIHKLTRGGGHGVLVTAPSHAAFHQGVAMTRKRGTCVLVGLAPEDFPMPQIDLVAQCITVRGSFAGTRRDMNEALALAASGLVSADVASQPQAPVNSVFGRPSAAQVAVPAMPAMLTFG